MTTAVSQHKKHTGFKRSHAILEWFCPNPSLGLAAPTSTGREGTQGRPRFPAVPHDFKALGPPWGGWSLEKPRKVRFSQRPSPAPSPRPSVSWRPEPEAQGSVSLHHRCLQMSPASGGYFCSSYGCSNSDLMSTDHLSLILGEGWGYKYMNIKRIILNLDLALFV